MMSVDKNLNSIVAALKNYIQSVSTIHIPVEGIVYKLQNNLSHLCRQLEGYRTVQRSTIPEALVETFPDVREKLKCKLNDLIMEEIAEITVLLDRLSKYSLDLQIKWQKIEKLYTTVCWQNYAPFLKSFTCVFEWSEKSWRLLTLMCLSVQKEIQSLNINKDCTSHSLKIVEAIDGFSKNDIFRNPVIEMFKLLELDIKSRNVIRYYSSASTEENASCDP